MPATYDPALIATNILHYARAQFRDVGGLQGTTVTLPLLQDEEYSGFVARFGEVEGLAKLAESLAANFAQKVSKYAQAGGIDVAWPNRPDFYLKLALNIRTYGVGDGASGLYAGRPVTPTPANDERLAFL